MKTIFRFFLYVRKSQGRSDRQVLSIPAQIKEMTAYAEKLGIKIVAVLQEERTAKEPGRPVFNEMMDRIENGEADGILTWKIARLSRNPVDDGRISWMLQRAIIKQIQTIERSYFPDDNVLFMRMEQGMANQYIRDLSKNVKRGLRTTADNGWLPVSILPLGYTRNKDKSISENLIIPHPTSYEKVKELWSLYATGLYSILEIKRLAEKFNLRTARGGVPSKNSYYGMFKNPFYAGYFYWNDIEGNPKQIQGKHKAMVTESEFLEIQDILDQKSRKTRPKEYVYPYKDFLTCGECRGSITAERKQFAKCPICRKKFSCRQKKTCSTCKSKDPNMQPKIVYDSTYYRCFKSNNPNCTQKAIKQVDIEKTIIESLSKIQITKDFYDLARDKIKSSLFQEEASPILLKSLKNKRREIDKKIKRLLDLRISGEISKEQCNMMHNEYFLELEEIKKEITRREGQSEKSKKEAHDYVKFALDCVKKFKSGCDIEKRKIIQALFSQLNILDKSLYISTKKPLEAIISVQSDSIDHA